MHQEVKMDRITFLVYSMDIGGTERVTHDLINEYISQGFYVNLICMRKTGIFLNELKICENNIYEVGCASSVVSIFRLANKIASILRVTQPDYFISMGEWPNIISPFVKFKGKFVIVEHNTKTFFSTPKEYNLSFRLKILSKIAYKKAPKILCVSQNIKDILLSINKSFSSKTEVIYNPIDYDKINKLSGEEIDYTTEKFKIINVGRFSSQKNIPLLLEAFAEVHKKVPDTELWLVGDGPIRKDLEVFTEKLGIKNSVVFWGSQYNPYKFISKANLFVSSSNYEGFPLVVLETIYLKKRIVTTRSISDFDDLITPDIGVVVPVGNKDLLEKGIIQEITNNQKILQIPEAIEKFSLKNVAKNYIKFLEESR